MTRRAAALLALLAACGADAPLPPVDLQVRVIGGAGEVRFGEGFPLQVVRVWHRELVPDAWRDEALAPLVVRLQQTARREDRERIEETRSYRAHLFQLGDVVLPPVRFRAQPAGGGPPRIAASAELRFTVRSQLAADDAAIELPGELLPLPANGLWPIAGLALLLLLGALRLRSRRRPAPVPLAPPPAPDESARARIAALRAQAPRGAGELQAWYVEAAALLRDHLAARFRLPAAERTTDELLRAPATTRALPAVARELLAGILRRCDLVKFARLEPPADDREALLRSAERLLHETAPAGAGERQAG
jgi:hypothetical protein